MPDRNIVVVGLLILAAGCAQARPTAQHPTVAAEGIELAAAVSLENGEPDSMPIDPALEGKHQLDFYVRLALERNPEISAAERDVAAATERIPQVQALDDPVLVDTFMPLTNHSVQTAAGRGPNMLSLSQRFPWFGKLRLRGEVAEQEAQIALSRLAQTQLKVAEDVRLAYYELYFHQRAIEITQEDEQLLNDIIKFIDARFITGQVLKQDLLGVQVELARVQDRLISLKRQLQISQADLAALLHASPDADLRAAKPHFPTSAPEEIEQLYAAAVRCRPELKERLYAIVRDQTTEELARLDFYPDMTMGIGWQAITANSAVSPVANGNDNLGFTVGMNLPIWRDKLRAGVRQAEHQTIASAHRYEATRDETFRLIRRLVVQARALEQQIRLFREPPDGIIPKSEETLGLSFENYKVGKVDYQQLINNWSRLLMFEIQLARMEASLGQTLASLERVVGCELATLREPDRGAGVDVPRPLPEPAELPNLLPIPAPVPN